MRLLFTTATYLPSINGDSNQIDLLKQDLLRQNHLVLILVPSSVPPFPAIKADITFLSAIPLPNHFP